MEYGFVYVMKNESMPNLYKIGYTLKSPRQRAIDLSRHTSVPSEFDVLFYCECICPNQFELDIHKIYEEKRHSLNREFFQLSIDDLMELGKGMKSFSDNFCTTYAFDEMLKAKTI
jgi:hypothetical protein